MKVFYFAVFCLLSIQSVYAQEKSDSALLSTSIDSFQNAHPKTSLAANSPYRIQTGTAFKNVLRYDFYATAAAISLINPTTDAGKGNIQLYYNATLNNRLIIEKFSWTFYLFNEYGYKQYIDSLGIKTDDNYNLRNAVQWDIYKGKLKLNGNINTKSQIWKGYQYEITSHNTVEKTLQSAYLSPGYIMYAGGISYISKNDIVFELGLASGKTTKIKNQAIFDARNAQKLYGLDKGEQKKHEFGFNLIITAPIIEITKNIYWETIALFYSNNKTLGFLNLYTMDINNAFHFLFFKYLRLSLRSKIIYDQAIQKNIFISNQISFGFYLSNKMKP